MLVPKQDLDSATAANGVAFNIGRAAGPALGGLVIAALGIAIPFWAFAASNVGIIAALIWWRSPRKGAHGLPAERLTMRAFDMPLTIPIWAPRRCVSLRSFLSPAPIRHCCRY